MNDEGREYDRVKTGHPFDGLAIAESLIEFANGLVAGTLPESSLLRQTWQDEDADCYVELHDPVQNAEWYAQNLRFRRKAILNDRTVLMISPDAMWRRWCVSYYFDKHRSTRYVVDGDLAAFTVYDLVQKVFGRVYPLVLNEELAMQWFTRGDGTIVTERIVRGVLISLDGMSL